jgi:uncharacterized protein (DUF1778 family)
MAEENLEQMSEEQLAAFYQSHRGDVSLWQKTSKPMRRRRGEGPSTSFAVRLSPEELEELQAAASERGTTLSDFIRSSALGAARTNGSTPAFTNLQPLVQQIRATRELLEQAERDLENSASKR